MDVVFSLLLKILTVLGGLILLLFYIFKKKGVSVSGASKYVFKYLLFFLLIIGTYASFFLDNDIVFTCHKSTMKCNYHHSTYTDRELRFVKSYPISAETRASVREKTVYRGKGRVRTYYQIIFQTGEKSFPFPKDFYGEEDAAEQSRHFNVFISSDHTFFKYDERHSKQESKEDIIFFILVSFNLIAVCWVALMVSDLFNHRKVKR